MSIKLDEGFKSLDLQTQAMVDALCENHTTITAILEIHSTKLKELKELQADTKVLDL